MVKAYKNYIQEQLDVGGIVRAWVGWWVIVVGIMGGKVWAL